MREARSTGHLPSYDQALGRVLGRVRALGAEPVPLAGALGCVLAEPVIADRDQPPFNRSMMDGYAVRSGEVCAGAVFDVVERIAAGAVADASADLSRGVVAIATGAAVPDGLDAVIPIEQSDEQAGRVLFTVGTIRPGVNVHPRGADARLGSVLIEPGTVLMPQHVGIAAAAGCVQPIVIRRPGVSLISTGDEVRPPATPSDDLATQQIRNANGPMLDAFQQALGVERLDHVHVHDDYQATLTAVREAIEKSDLVLSVGGVSVGTRDYLPRVLGELGFETVIQGVSMQPGKPIFIAQADDGSGTLFVGLPGNPVSALATAHLFVWPIVRVLMGRSSQLPWRHVELVEDVKPNARREAFRCAALIEDQPEQVRVIGWQNSGDLAHTSRADGFVRLPVQEEALHAGARVAFLPMIGRLP